MENFDLVEHLARQQDFSLRTFGPGARTKGLIDHIQKELREIANDPTDLMEWIDVIMLGLDGAWRSGHLPEEIAQALHDKLERNEARDWPDWRTADPDKAIEHVRTGEKTYYADPSDHDAVAQALLDKYRDQPAAMKFQVQELRPEVMAFALLMEQRLRDKDAEHGGNSWQSASAKEIVIPTTAKALHLDSVVRDVHHLNLSPIKHAVDLANYAMMIADVAGALETNADEARDA